MLSDDVKDLIRISVHAGASPSTVKQALVLSLVTGKRYDEVCDIIREVERDVNDALSKL